MDKGSVRLKKELSLFNIYAIATGATLSSGFFLLPGLAAAEAGPAVILSYVIAAVHLIPAVLSMAELSTAMPRAGGIYYFLDRSLGPLAGAIGGLGTWLALVLKTAFALVGMGAYLGLFFPDVPIIPLAIGLAILFGLVNLGGAKKTSGFQVVLVVGLLAIVGGFTGHGLLNLKASHFLDFFQAGFTSIYATAGLVYISYVGLTNIASVSEEVKNPERNLPLAMILALGTAIIIYVAGTTVMVGVLSPAEFHNDLTPVATAARNLAGPWGALLITIAAVLAFFSVTNAATLSASRYPLAMSRDHLVPGFFGALSKQGTPRNAIYATVALVILCLVAFDPTRIAKLASAFQLLLFALSCLAVIIMRESRIDSYDPGYRSPLYPWMQIAGVVGPVLLIAEMGLWPILFTAGLIALGTAWYFAYASDKVVRDGAIYHIFARLGERRFEGLDSELRGILKEKGLRDEDPFDVLIARAAVIDLPDCVSFEELAGRASEQLAERLRVPKATLEEGFLKGTMTGATPVAGGAALPHLRIREIEHQELVIVRAQRGVSVRSDELDLEGAEVEITVHAVFFLVSPEESPHLHLRMLAQIATQVDDERFMRRWFKCRTEQDLKELLLRDEYHISVRLSRTQKNVVLIGQHIRDLDIPEGLIIALIHRGDEVIFPRGWTVLQEGDRLTVLGEPQDIERFIQTFCE